MFQQWPINKRKMKTNYIKPHIQKTRKNKLQFMTLSIGIQQMMCYLMRCKYFLIGSLSPGWMIRAETQSLYNHCKYLWGQLRQKNKNKNLCCYGKPSLICSHQTFRLSEFLSTKDRFLRQWLLLLIRKKKKKKDVVV